VGLCFSVAGLSLNAEMVKAGWAVAYARYSLAYSKVWFNTPELAPRRFILPVAPGGQRQAVLTPSITASNSWLGVQGKTLGTAFSAIGKTKDWPADTVPCAPLLLNYFLPAVKLINKTRLGSRSARSMTSRGALANGFWLLPASLMRSRRN
jgi:hypothetical protein